MMMMMLMVMMMRAGGRGGGGDWEEEEEEEAAVFGCPVASPPWRAPFMSAGRGAAHSSTALMG